MSDQTDTPQSTEAELITIRREKLAKMRELGIDPFGGKFETTISPGALKADFSDEKKVTIAGRLTACLLYTSPSPRDQRGSRMPSSA